MKNIVYRFDEVLGDGYGCLLLGDMYALKQFQAKNQLDENLQIPLTTTSVGDDVVQQGAVIYLGMSQNPMVLTTPYFSISPMSHR